MRSRLPTAGLSLRAYELRANGSAYDALAEGLACPLVTADARLGRAAGVTCPIKVFRP